MNASLHRVFIAAAVCAAIIVAPALAAADVTVERFVKTGGLGGIGASESTSVEKLSGLRKREATKTKLTGGFGALAGAFGAGDMGGDSITDINKDKVIALNHKNKTYTESSISAAMKEFKDAGGQSSPQGREPGKKGEEKANVRVVRNEMNVVETGKTKTINGFACSEYLVTWLVETENIETKERSTNTMTMDLWNTAETKEMAALRQAEQDFSTAYLKKMGFDASNEDWNKFGMGMIAGLLGGDEKTMKKDMAELSKKMAKIKGYSIATSIKWEMSGMAGAREAAEAEEAPPAEEEEPAVDISKGFGGLLSGLAKKAAKSAAPKKQPAKEEKKAGNVLFDSYSEVKSISSAPLPASDFDVPAGYKLTTK